MEKRKKTVRILLENGASIDARDSRGYYPLHMAARSGNEKAIKILMEFGALHKATANDGKKPFEIASSPKIAKFIVTVHTQLKRDSQRAVMELRILKENLLQVQQQNLQLQEQVKKLMADVNELRNNT